MKNGDCIHIFVEDGPNYVVLLTSALDEGQEKVAEYGFDAELDLAEFVRRLLTGEEDFETRLLGG